MNRISLITACLLILTGCNWWGTSEEKQPDPLKAISNDIAEIKQMLSDMEKKQTVKPVCNTPKKSKPVITGIAPEKPSDKPLIKLVDVKASDKSAVLNIYCRNGKIKKAKMTEGERIFFEDGGQKYVLDLKSVKKTGACRSEAVWNLSGRKES